MLTVVTGCSSFSEMNFEVLRPAGFSFPPDIKSVVLVDNSKVFSDTSVNVIRVDDEIILVDTTKLNDYTKMVLNAVKSELENRVFFDSVYVDTIKYKSISKGKMIDKLTNNQIIDICDKFGADAIVSLDAYRYANNINVTSSGNPDAIIVLNEIGTTLKTSISDSGDSFFSSYDASAINLWRIYNCSDRSVLNVYVQKDTIFWDGFGLSINSSLSNFIQLDKATREIGSYLSYQLVDYLAPYWEEVTRQLYTSGNMHFLNATDWVNKDNWQEAEKTWNYIYENGSKKAKIKASLNLALSLERRGEIDEAKNWTSKAYTLLLEMKSLNKTKLKMYVVFYYKDLQKRTKEYEKLVEQLGEGD